MGQGQLGTTIGYKADPHEFIEMIVCLEYLRDDPIPFDTTFYRAEIGRMYATSWVLSEHSASSALQSLARKDPGRFKRIPKAAFLNSEKSMVQSGESGRFKRCGFWVSSGTSRTHYCTVTTTVPTVAVAELEVPVTVIV
jgi:hypothetical protein